MGSFQVVATSALLPASDMRPAAVTNGTNVSRYPLPASLLAVLHRSVLLLEDKTPIGRVEEVFGPLTMPLYALRYAGPQPPPAALATSARVFFTGKCSHTNANNGLLNGTSP